MKYQIVGKNIEVTSAIEKAVIKKLSKMDKFFQNPDEVSCRVVVRSYKVGSKIEVTIFTPQMDFRAEVKNNDLYCGIDEAVTRIQSQIRRLKARYERSRDRKLSLGKSLALENIDNTVSSEEVSEDVVRTKSVFLTPMTLEEAIMRMEAIDHNFFIYLDKDDGKIAVCYAREDSGYGVIEAENEIV